MLSFILVIVGTLLFLLIAYIFSRIAEEITQEADTFWNVVGFCLALFAIGAIGLHFFLPPLPGPARLSSFVELTDPKRVSSLLTRGDGEILEAQ